MVDLDVSFADQSEEGLNSVGPIAIENNVWIGADVKIMDGVNVGHDAVIGAGAVVRSYIPAYSIAAGVPAKIIRSRKPEPAAEAEQETTEAVDSETS